ncbi:rnhA operon protein [Halonotius terrestris]|uniref:RnhA operon protein n=1 Tax=Halonotius terrestris TaxID=2487750 RepID=A0A8J8TDU1_9EURY|nr:rnhA operon protein [Halonotius terrestris]
MTRLARQVGDEAEQEAYRAQRDDTLAEHDYTARLREEDETLVLYPDAWLDGDTVRLERVEDTDRAVEVSLSATAGDDDWAAIEAANAELVERVADEHGSPHAANARAFADFMGNHYLTRIEDATAEHVQEFTEEYYPRNAWATADQRAAVDASLEYLFAAADTECPTMPADVEN